MYHCNIVMTWKLSFIIFIYIIIIIIILSPYNFQNVADSLVILK